MAPCEARPRSDTSPEVEAPMDERLRRMTPSQRFEQGVKTCTLARRRMRAGIRMRHPDHDEAQVDGAGTALVGRRSPSQGPAELAAARPMTDELTDALREIATVRAPQELRARALVRRWISVPRRLGGC